MDKSEMKEISIDFSDPQQIEDYAKNLEGMTFQDVLNLGITADESPKEYNKQGYKGGMGTLLEERYFGYKANSAQAADFSDAGVELKATCYDIKKNGDPSAGERLVITMIPFNGPIEDDFYQSHAWEKAEKMLLVFYERNRNIDKYNQKITHVRLFTPPEEDLKIIEDDYNKIVSIVKSGKAEELSESLTTYLGACTKGATEATMWVEQYYPPHTKAKKRAFCLKRQYMDYILHHHILQRKTDAEAIIKDKSELNNVTFDEIVLSKINQHIGTSDKELCKILDIKYTGNKAQWAQITYRLLGIKSNKAEEFLKANISVRTVRVKKNGGIKESMSLHTITFMELIEENWEDSWLHNYFNETRFLFVSFQETDDGFTLAGAKFWSMPQSDIEGPLKACWIETKKAATEGIKFEIKWNGDKVVVTNNLPKKKDNPVTHVRPHTAHAYYSFKDGTIIGTNPSDGDLLPNGETMTKQSFWLNNSYVYSIIEL